MTRLDLFKKWLEEQGANMRDFKITEGMVEYPHHCYGFVCPDDVPALAENQGAHIVDCLECKYNEFWAKEIEESLANLKELQKDYQQFHDDVWQDPESYGTIAESLKVAISTMHKYQKIQEIIKDWENGRCSDAACCLRIKAEVDGNDI